MIWTVSFAATSFTSAHTTFAPSRANVTAVAFPLPQPGPIDPAPTTSATLSFSRSAMSVLALPEVAFAQFGLEDFSVIVLRQRVDEHVFLRPLEPRDAIQAQRVEFTALGFSHHVGNDDLAPFRIGSADH